jgi:hypothetical protein
MEELQFLEGPYEIFELGDGGKYTFRPTKWKLGWMEIHPRWLPKPKRIKALRIWIPEEYKPLFPDYWDVTAQTLIAQLVPILERPDFTELLITVTKYGVAPKARFKVEVKRVAS